MNLNLEELKKDVREGQIKAITLDTNIFCKYHFNFESGLLNELKQFSDSSVNLIISKIVQQEILSKLTERSHEIQRKIKLCLEDAQKNFLIDSLDFENISDAVFKESNFRKRVFERLENFKSLTSFHIVENDDISIDDLLDKYFNHESPFKNIKNKKHEFPDAIALMSLEIWADDNETKVIVVSDDNDWEEFCKNTSKLICINDLGKALELFQDPSFDDVCKYLSEKHQEGILDNINNNILESLNDQICNFIEIDIDYSVTITDFEFKPFENPNTLFRLVDSSDTTLVVMSELIVQSNFCFGSCLGDYEYDQELYVTISISFYDYHISNGVIDLQDLSIEVDINNVVPQTIDMDTVFNGYQDECDSYY